MTRNYIVTFHERMIITESVEATSKAEAIRLVKAGEGYRLDAMTDEEREPTSFQAWTEEQWRER